MTDDELKEKIRIQNEKYLNKIISFDYPNNKHFKNLSGLQFEMIHVDNYLGKDKKSKTYYWCTCDCGNKVITCSETLLKNEKQSCGCSTIKLITKNRVKYKHGDAKSNQHSKLYMIWQSMRKRCNNVNDAHYDAYGGRGIKVCPEWDNTNDGYLNYKSWALNNGYIEGMTIDRINNSLGYSPNNCRVTDKKLQANNTRKNVYAQINNYVFSISIWADILKIKSDTIYKRLQCNWPVNKAILLPINSTINDNIFTTIEIPDFYFKYNKYEECVNKKLAIRYNGDSCYKIIHLN